MSVQNITETIENVIQFWFGTHRCEGSVNIVKQLLSLTLCYIGSANESNSGMHLMFLHQNFCWIQVRKFHLCNISKFSFALYDVKAVDLCALCSLWGEYNE